MIRISITSVHFWYLHVSHKESVSFENEIIEYYSMIIFISKVWFQEYISIFRAFPNNCELYYFLQLIEKLLGNVQNKVNSSYIATYICTAVTFSKKMNSNTKENWEYPEISHYIFFVFFMQPFVTHYKCCWAINFERDIVGVFSNTTESIVGNQKLVTLYKHEGYSLVRRHVKEVILQTRINHRFVKIQKKRD